MDLQDCRVIILTGTGEKAFCAGGDLKERHGMSDAQWGAQHLVYERMVRAVMGCPVPVIAAVNGAAYGGGCELAAMADFAYAADTARFAQTEVRLGIIPGAGRLPGNLARAVQERRAKDLILSGRVFSADEACRWGLVLEVAAPEQLQELAMDSARQIARNGPVAVRQAKQAIRAAGCRCHWQTGWPLRLKPITGPSRPKTDVKEWPPLTRNARATFTGD